MQLRNFLVATLPMIVASRTGGAPTGLQLPAVYLVPVASWLQGVQFCART
jgi:hypothetical protein